MEEERGEAGEAAKDRSKGEPLKDLNGAVLRSGKGGGWVGGGGAGGRETSREATEVVA